ncbi:hypothetical protein STAS_21012 [Striga asiatica]|uniref:Uncharacterized protein n=1 Tax=Striga asiatica TaxID=4170 RepID=A0A5A7QGV9_STRAF|nr:hypothetical protein STAS_21012 [Striga asiatica]
MEFLSQSITTLRRTVRMHLPEASMRTSSPESPASGPYESTRKTSSPLESWAVKPSPAKKSEVLKTVSQTTEQSTNLVEELKIGPIYGTVLDDEPSIFLLSTYFPARESNSIPAPTPTARSIV